MTKEKVVVLVSGGVAELIVNNSEKVDVDIFDYDDWEEADDDIKLDLVLHFINEGTFEFLPKWLKEEMAECKLRVEEKIDTEINRLEEEIARLKDEKNGVYPAKWDIAN